MTDLTRLNQVFEQFALFGVSAVQSSGSLSAEVTMDNAKFAKLCRDCRIIGGAVTTVDVDIYFKKVLVKGERKINFEQFKSALAYLAAKKYPGDAQDYAKAVALVSKAAPATTATAVSTKGIFDKLTNTSLYTGTHKERFDAEGKGKGLAGRDTISKTNQLSSMVARNSGTTPAKRGVTASMEQIAAPAAKVPAKKADVARPVAKPLSAKSKGTTNKSSDSVYDRLTNSKQYTGTHKLRFDASGKGRGLAGRDSPATGAGTVTSYKGGNVHSLAQILRN